ncbi:MAG: PaaI family thioesterase [Prevotella sp.]|nr:PaaI family thioesterase [Prevotella sp.]
MDVELVRKVIETMPNLSTNLGMNFISTSDQDMCMATMEVNERNRQPFGFLSGGASLALAENVAGVGSTALCPGKICVGVSVSGEHVKAVEEGDTVTALARLVSKGRKLHVWNVDITNSSGELVSTVHVTNYIITPKAKNGRDVKTPEKEV